MNDEIRSKKLLVRYDVHRCRAVNGDFLVPILDGSGPHFWGMRSKKCASIGQVVYVGTEVGVTDLLDELSEAAQGIEDCERIRSNLLKYLQGLREFKIGNILAIEAMGEDTRDFRIIKVADHEPFEKGKLP